MVVADPTAELVGLVRAMGDPAPETVAEPVRRQAELVRRRFGLALPPPFVAPPGPEEPVRVATPHDGAAIASVKWRVFGTSYRGVLPDHFLDARDVVPPATYWTGRAMVPPTRRHRLLVWGRPGTVYGYVDCGPAHADEITPSAAGSEPPGQAGEVWELYVDPSAQGCGGGARLLDGAETWLDSVGLHHQELSVVRTNPRAQGFYEAHGWRPTGRTVAVDLGVVAFEEVRFARVAGSERRKT